MVSSREDDQSEVGNALQWHGLPQLRKAQASSVEWLPDGVPVTNHSYA